jgi:hypothetical protein
MFRSLSALALLALPASAQVTLPDLQAEDIPTGVLSCERVGADIGCLTALEERVDFCLAVDREGRPVANSASVSATGVVTFQNVEIDRIAELRCRPTN